MKMNFKAIQGELLVTLTEQLVDMHTYEDGTNYEEYYIDLNSIMVDVNRIDSLDSLSKFCDDYGLNDGIFEGVSFPEIISKYCK